MKPRPNQNSSASHFWVANHQLRNAVLNDLGYQCARPSVRRWIDSLNIKNELCCQGAAPTCNVPNVSLVVAADNSCCTDTQKKYDDLSLRRIPPPPAAHETQLNELWQIKNCYPCANGHGIFVLLHYRDLMQTVGAVRFTPRPPSPSPPYSRTPPPFVL